MEVSGARTERVSSRTALALGIAWLVLTAPVGVASRPVPSGDEAREAAVAKAMLQSGDWSRSALGGQVLYEKPPFFYMAVALSARAAGGLTPAAARFPSVLFAALAMGATGWAGARLFKPVTGLVAMALLSTTYLFAVNAHNCLIDVPLAGFVALGLAAFAVRARRDEPRWDGLWGSAAAGSLLAKGLVGPVLLVFLTAPIWWLSPSRRPLAKSVSLLAVGLPLSAFALWMGVTIRAFGPDGIYQVLWLQNVGRFLGLTGHGYDHHRAGFLFYLAQLPGILFPWTPLVLVVLVTAWFRSRRHALLPLAAGFLAALLFLSASGTKRTVYLLPLMPAAALLAAGYAEIAASRPIQGERVVLAAQVVLLAAGLAAAVFLFVSRPGGDPEGEFYREVDRRLPSGAPLPAYNVNLDVLGKALFEMSRPVNEEYSVERAAEACRAGNTFVLSEVEHLLPPHVAPLRSALVPVYVGPAEEKLVALYRCRALPEAR